MTCIELLHRKELCHPQFAYHVQWFSSSFCVATSIQGVNQQFHGAIVVGY
jgi:hypothetical protein